MAGEKVRDGNLAAPSDCYLLTFKGLYPLSMAKFIILSAEILIAIFLVVADDRTVSITSAVPIMKLTDS